MEILYSTFNSLLELSLPLQNASLSVFDGFAVEILPPQSRLSPQLRVEDGRGKQDRIEEVSMAHDPREISNIDILPSCHRSVSTNGTGTNKRATWDRYTLDSAHFNKD